MARRPQLLDPYGRPVRRSELVREVAAASIGSIRSPISGTPGDGLDPVRLANILRSADQGDPERYLELAEQMEERNAHYLGILGTRRRSVSQVPIRVRPASDTPDHVQQADMIEAWLKRKELQGELFDILDAIGKGYSFTEIIWDSSEGDWTIDRLEFRDPRWFPFDRKDLKTPMMRGAGGEELPLPAYKFIFARIHAKSGLTLRSGLARVATWNWLFKAYTEKDWAIFTQTYGQPLRVGKWGPGASEGDKDTLFQAVANIAGDCAATIPDSMSIEFVETSNVGASTEHYERRADWLDKQLSKAVLGQTATTDSVTGGLGSGTEHREVQEDIARADCAALSAILTRDIGRPWIDLQFGRQEAYPVIEICEEEPEDLAALTSGLQALVPLGLRVRESEVREKFGLSEPGKNDVILGQNPEIPPEADPESDPEEQTSKFKRVSWPVKRGSLSSGPQPPERLQRASAGLSEPFSPEDILADQIVETTNTEMTAMVATIEAMLRGAESLDEFRERVLAGFPDLDTGDLVEILAQAMTAAHAGGRAQVAEEASEDDG